MRSRLLPAILIIGVVALSNCALAWGDTEPNNNIGQAEGPIGAAPVSGTLNTDKDSDWYWTALSGQKQISITVSLDNAGECNANVGFELISEEGDAIGSAGTVLREERGEYPEVSYSSEPGSFTYTTPPGPARTYYVAVAGGTETGNCNYSFSIGPSSAFSPPPAKPPVQPVSEPNDTRGRAFGPLRGNILYSGEIEAASDVDLLYLVAKPEQHADAYVTSFGCGFGVGVKLFSALPGEPLRSDGETEYLVRENERRGLELPLSAVLEPLYLEITGEPGCSYYVQVAPPSAVVARIPGQGGQSLCAKSRRISHEWKRSLDRAEQALATARSRAVRGHLHHQVEARRRALRAAKHQVKVKCT
jgi:hypothetical protein